MDLKKRKLLILCLFYIDLFFHGLLTFGWSSIDQIMKHEGFYKDSNDVTSNSDQAQTSGQIFVSSIVRVPNQRSLAFKEGLPAVHY